jgi:hypothetical protein
MRYIGDESISIYNWVTERSLYPTVMEKKKNYKEKVLFFTDRHLS